MAEAIETAKVICEGGLYSSQNFLSLSENSPGSANSLINFEASLYGGYRRLDGYAPLTSQNSGTVDLAGGNGKILCVAIHRDLIICARKIAGNLYKFYVANANLNWTQLTSGSLTLSSIGVTKIRWITFNFNGTEKIMFVDGVNKPTIYDGTNWSTVSGDQLILKPRYINVWKNTIFLSGDQQYPQLVAYSNPSDESIWTAAGGAGQILAGFDVMQIKPFREALYVFGRKNIKKIELNSTTFVINDVAANIGCIASDSVVEANGDLLFLASDGIRTISGTEKIGDVNIASVSKKIQQVVVGMITDHVMDEVTALVVPNKSQVRFLFSDPTDPDNTANGIIGCIRESNGDGVWEWGELKGIRASCATNGFIINQQYVLHGDYNGKVYREEVGNTFDGQPINATYQTPYLDFGDTQRRKTMRVLNVFVRPEGNLSLLTNVNYDYGSMYVLNPLGYITTSGGTVAEYGLTIHYGEAGAVYGRVTTPVMVTNIQGSFFSTQLTFSTNTISPSYSIQGLVFEISIDGRN